MKYEFGRIFSSIIIIMSNFIQIGSNTIINGKKNLVASEDSKIQIGKYCAIANGCNIIT